MKWLERAAWLSVGLAIGSWTAVAAEFVTQAVLGHSPLNPKENP